MIDPKLLNTLSIQDLTELIEQRGAVVAVFTAEDVATAIEANFDDGEGPVDAPETLLRRYADSLELALLDAGNGKLDEWLRKESTVKLPLQEPEPEYAD